jgi:hypothetical protein
MKTSIIVLLSVVGVLLVSSFWFYGFVNSTRNDGISMEQQISKHYEDNQNELSNYISSFYEQIGVANLKSDKMDTILKNAVQGRYGEQGFKANGAFFAAVKEAYPSLEGLNVFDRIMDHVSSGRTSFKAQQSRLLDLLREYDTWKQQGIVRSQLVRIIGFPTENLQARVGGKVIATGPLALNQFHQLVLTSSTTEAFTTGKMEPLKVK